MNSLKFFLRSCAGIKSLALQYAFFSRNNITASRCLGSSSF